MSTTYVAELDQIEFPAISPQGSTVVRIAADRLDVGMYVVELESFAAMCAEQCYACAFFFYMRSGIDCDT